MPHPGQGFPIPPFEWPHVGRQWPAYNVESDQAEDLALWLPYGGSYPGLHRHNDTIGGLVFTEYGTPTWVFDNERGWSLLFDDAASEYLLRSGAVVSSPPFTLAAWARRDDAALESAAVVGLHQNWGPGDSYLRVNTDGTLRFTTGGVALNTVGAPDDTEWHHLCGVSAASDDHAALFDGGSKVTSSSAGSYTHEYMAIGVFYAGDGGSNAMYFSGSVSDIRIYNAAKNDAQAYQIATDPGELFQIPPRLWRLGAIAPPPPTAALPIFPPPDSVHSLVFGGVTVR